MHTAPPESRAEMSCIQRCYAGSKQCTEHRENFAGEKKSNHQRGCDQGILFPCIYYQVKGKKSWYAVLSTPDCHDMTFLGVIFGVMFFAVLRPALYVLYKTKSAHGCCIYSCLCNYLCTGLGGVFILSSCVTLLLTGFNSNINLPGREESGSAPTSPSLQLQDKNANNHSTHSSSPAPIENGNQISNGERGLFESQHCLSNRWLVVFFVWLEAEDENRRESFSSRLLCSKLREPRAGIADIAYLIKNKCSFLAQNHAFKGNFSQPWAKFILMQYFLFVCFVRRNAKDPCQTWLFFFLLCKYCVLGHCQN